MSDIRIFQASTTIGECYLIFFENEVVWMSPSNTTGGVQTPVFFKADKRNESVVLTCAAPEYGTVDRLYAELGADKFTAIFEGDIELAVWEDSILLDSDVGCIGSSDPNPDSQ
jgi:hypothetical protein